MEKLPEIAKSVAEPLSKTEKIVVVDNGGSDSGKSGAARVSGYVTDIISSLPETVETLTFINLVETISGAVKKDSKVTVNKEDLTEN